MQGGALHVDPEGITVRHVGEGLAGAGDRVLEAGSIHRDLAYLATGHVVSWHEIRSVLRWHAGSCGRLAALVAADIAPLWQGQPLDIDPERLRGWHIFERLLRA